MTRTNVYERIDPSDCLRSDEPAALAGWFDRSKAECFEQDTRWDGNNQVGVISGSQWVDEYLFRTKGGRWVRNHDAHRDHDGPDTYEFLTDEQAKDWLLRSECNDDAIKRFFGEVEEERGPGRPAIGEAINVRLGELLGRVDAFAAESGVSRAEAIRELVAAGLIKREGH